MTKKLTRLGARELTEAIDRIASTVQENHALLGIDPRIAFDYAHRSDLISDAVEGQAASNFPCVAEDYDAGEIAEGVPGPLGEDGDEPYMDTFNESEHGELTDRVEGNTLEDLGKFASLLAEAEQMFVRAGSSLPDITVQGYAGFTDQIRQLSELADKAAAIQAKLDAAVGDLLKEKKLADKAVAQAHEEIKKAYKDGLSAVGNVTIARKTQLVEAQAMLQVVARKRTTTQVQKELMAAVAEKYGAEVVAFISDTTSALQDTNKKLAVSFKGFELESRALSKTAGSKEAGLLDLVTKFQEMLVKNWRKMVSMAKNLASLVSNSGKQVERAHGEFMKVLGGVQTGKLASVAPEAPEVAKAAHFNLFK